MQHYSFRQRVRSLYRALFPEDQTPLRISASVFAGVFIGVFPTLGFALPLTALATTLCRLPKGPGLVASFIATPPTLFVFFYPLGYLLGRVLTRPPSVELELLDEMRRLTLSTAKDVLGNLWGQAQLHLLAFLLGMFIVSLLTAALVGAASYWIITRRGAAARLS